MTSAGSVSDIPQFRKLTEFPSSLDCFLCSVTKATSFAVGREVVEVMGVDVVDIAGVVDGFRG